MRHVRSLNYFIGLVFFFFCFSAQAMLLEIIEVKQIQVFPDNEVLVELSSQKLSVESRLPQIVPVHFFDSDGVATLTILTVLLNQSLNSQWHHHTGMPNFELDLKGVVPHWDRVADVMRLSWEKALVVYTKAGQDYASALSGLKTAVKELTSDGPVTYKKLSFLAAWLQENAEIHNYDLSYGGEAVKENVNIFSQDPSHPIDSAFRDYSFAMPPQGYSRSKHDFTFNWDTLIVRGGSFSQGCAAVVAHRKEKLAKKKS